MDDDSLKFEYRPDTTKWRTKYYENGTMKYTKYHFGNNEKFVYPNGDTKNLFYIFGGKELTGLYIKENSSGQMAYVISDHLGSVWALANDQGGFIEQYAYDPWGKRMDPTDWTKPDTTRTEFKTDRGFTLHEHYDHMQIVNMNARMYDPLMGQFISVDPLADKYPGWGAYVYCLNNPLIYLDLDGREVDLAQLNKDHQAALEQLVSTKAGTKFISKFLGANTTLNINGNDYKFNSDGYAGANSKDVLQMTSKNMEANGENETLNKRLDRKALSPSEGREMLEDGALQKISIGNHRDTKEATITMAHEFFVHADNDAFILTKARYQLDGPDTENAAGTNALDVNGNGEEDHKALAKGEVNEFEDAMSELSKITGDNFYIDEYEDQAEDYARRLLEGE